MKIAQLSQIHAERCANLAILKKIKKRISKRTTFVTINKVKRCIFFKRFKEEKLKNLIHLHHCDDFITKKQYFFNSRNKIMDLLTMSFKIFNGNNKLKINLKNICRYNLVLSQTNDDPYNFHKIHHALPK